MTTMTEKARLELLLGQAMRKERTRCEMIALSFLKDAKTEGEKYIAERIAEVIRWEPVRSTQLPSAKE